MVLKQPQILTDRFLKACQWLFVVLSQFSQNSLKEPDVLCGPGSSRAPVVCILQELVKVDGRQGKRRKQRKEAPSERTVNPGLVRGMKRRMLLT